MVKEADVLLQEPQVPQMIRVHSTRHYCVQHVHVHADHIYFFKFNLKFTRRRIFSLHVQYLTFMYIQVWQEIETMLT